MQRYDAVIRATQTADLDANCNDIISAFGAAYEQFMTAFSEAVPPTLSNQYCDIVTPKVHAILNVLPDYVATSGRGLHRLDEQAFEAIHSRYSIFLQKRRGVRPVSISAPKLRQEQRYSILQRAAKTPTPAPNSNSRPPKRQKTAPTPTHSQRIPAPLLLPLPCLSYCHCCRVLHVHFIQKSSSLRYVQGSVICV